MHRSDWAVGLFLRVFSATLKIDEGIRGVSARNLDPILEKTGVDKHVDAGMINTMAFPSCGHLGRR